MEMGAPGGERPQCPSAGTEPRGGAGSQAEDPNSSKASIKVGPQSQTTGHVPWGQEASMDKGSEVSGMAELIHMKAVVSLLIFKPKHSVIS